MYALASAREMLSCSDRPKSWIGQRAEAQRDAEAGSAPQFAHQRQHRLPQNHGIFARLNVNVGDRRRPVMNDQLGQFIRREPVARQHAVVTAHRTVMAVLAAVAGNLDDAANKNAASEDFIAQPPRLLLQRRSRSIRGDGTHSYSIGRCRCLRRWFQSHQA
jgi:hypothetical protein